MRIEWDDWLLEQDIPTREELEREIPAPFGVVFSNYSVAMESVFVALMGDETYPIVVGASACQETALAIDRRNVWALVVDIDSKLHADPEKVLAVVDHMATRIALLPAPFGKSYDENLLRELNDRKVMCIHEIHNIPLPGDINLWPNNHIRVMRLPGNGAVVCPSSLELMKNLKHLRDNIFFDMLPAMAAVRVKNRIIADFMPYAIENRKAVVAQYKEAVDKHGLVLGPAYSWWSGFSLCVENARRAAAQLASYEYPSLVFTTMPEREEDIVDDDYPGCKLASNRILQLPLHTAVTLTKGNQIDKMLGHIAKVEGTHG